MKALLIIPVLMLAACASQPEVRYQPFPVKVPISVPCAAAVPEEPKWKRGLVDLNTASKDQKVAALEAELIQREAYEGELKAAITGCQKGK